MYQYILFDLDGTLTDPREGITKSVQYALDKMGISEPDLSSLEHFIGPPLYDEFRRCYNMDDQQAKTAVAAYRERFGTVGWTENILFDGSRAVQPPEKGPERSHFAVHRPGAELSLLRAENDPFADLLGRDRPRVEPRLVAVQPREELLHVVAVVADRERRVAAFGFEVSDEIGDHT